MDADFANKLRTHLRNSNVTVHIHGSRPWTVMVPVTLLAIDLAKEWRSQDHPNTAVRLVVGEEFSVRRSHAALSREGHNADTSWEPRGVGVITFEAMWQKMMEREDRVASLFDCPTIMILDADACCSKNDLIAAAGLMRVVGRRQGVNGSPPVRVVSIGACVFHGLAHMRPVSSNVYLDLEVEHGEVLHLQFLEADDVSRASCNRVKLEAEDTIEQQRKNVVVFDHETLMELESLGPSTWIVGAESTRNPKVRNLLDIPDIPDSNPDLKPRVIYVDCLAFSYPLPIINVGLVICSRAKRLLYSREMEEQVRAPYVDRQLAGVQQPYRTDRFLVRYKEADCEKRTNDRLCRVQSDLYVYAFEFALLYPIRDKIMHSSEMPFSELD